jgi:tetratricopeptide (TPR) repeat protein
MAKFLVIEEDDYTYRGLRQVLDPLGHELVVAEDSTTLNDLLQQHQPDLLMVAPRLLDDTVLANLRSGDSGIPVMFLITRAESGLVAPGVDRFVYTSPLDVEALRHVVSVLFPSATPQAVIPTETLPQPIDEAQAAEYHADALAHQGKRSEAAAEYVRASDLYRKRRQVSKIIACLENSIQIMPTKEAYVRLAEAYDHAGDKQRATENYLRLAQVFQQERALERALYALRQALRIDPRNPQILDVMRRLQTSEPDREVSKDAKTSGEDSPPEDDSAATVILSKGDKPAEEVEEEEVADLDIILGGEQPEPSLSDAPVETERQPASGRAREVPDWLRETPPEFPAFEAEPSAGPDWLAETPAPADTAIPVPRQGATGGAAAPEDSDEKAKKSVLDEQAEKPDPAPPRPAAPAAAPPPAPPLPSIAPPQPITAPAQTTTGEAVAVGPGGTTYQDQTPKMEGGKSGAPVQFAAYYPKEVTPEEWKPLTAYVYKTEFAAKIAEDAKNIFGGVLKHMRRVGEGARQTIQEGALIVATPNIPGFQCNPPSLSVYFYEDWQRFDFKLRAKDAPLNQATNGSLTFSVEGIIVADVPLAIFVGAAVLEEEDTVSVTNDPYQAIFCSYSHKDKKIVERVERAYKALGLDYLRDVSVLKSGQEWDDQLLKLIDEADIFQLFWSSSAATSPYVKQEYEHALKRHKAGFNFIRPVYWEEPIPSVPSELGHIHFAFQPELDD